MAHKICCKFLSRLLVLYSALNATDKNAAAEYAKKERSHFVVLCTLCFRWSSLECVENYQTYFSHKVV